MIDIFSDERTIMTLDAGGTNFVFYALQKGKSIIDPIKHPANGDNLELCLHTMIKGFEEVKSKLDTEPAAISFAFPGPADYPNGIIGDLVNLPGFRGGVAIGPMLEEKFGIPVFVNNDGDLYVYGEALGGILPEINDELEKSGNPKRYRHLVGYTLGTGFGGGMVIDGQLFIGDNSMGGEISATRGAVDTNLNVEEEISTRAIQRYYAVNAGLDVENVGMPKDIYDIAMGEKSGDKGAALQAFATFGESLGCKIAEMIAMFDCIMVIGGGLTGARELIMPSLMKAVRGTYNLANGTPRRKLNQQIFDLNNDSERKAFFKNDSVEIKVPYSDKTVLYNSDPMIGVAFSNIDTGYATSLGAYAFALSKLN